MAQSKKASATKVTAKKAPAQKAPPKSRGGEPVLLSLQDWSEDWVKALEEQQ